jgi:hypothetical protein
MNVCIYTSKNNLCVGPWLWKKAKIKEEARSANCTDDKLTKIGSKWPKEKKRRSEVRERKSLDEEIKDDRLARKRDRGQLSKKKNPTMDALEHLTGKKERQYGKVLKMQVKLT